MAAPDSITALNFSGKWYMNKTLSDSTDEILKQQGVSWVKRTVIGAASITLDVKHYKDDDGVERIDIDQTLTGGISGTREERILNWTPRPHNDHIFGPIIGKSRRAKLEEVEDEYLKKGWLPDTVETGVINSLVESDTPKSNTTWTAEQVWGFQVADGVRRWTRHIRFVGPKGDIILARVYYDYAGDV